jgi:hypothetical protein
VRDAVERRGRGPAIAFEQEHLAMHDVMRIQEPKS